MSDKSFITVGHIRERILERVARSICRAQGGNPDDLVVYGPLDSGPRTGMLIIPQVGCIGEPLPMWRFYSGEAEAALNIINDEYAHYAKLAIAE